MKDLKVVALSGSSPGLFYCFQDLLRKAIVKQSQSLQFDLASIRTPYWSPASSKGELQASPSDFCGTIHLVSLVSRNMFCFGLNYGP